MGCHSPSPTVPSSLFASFPFLTEKEARGSPRNGNYRRNLFGETLGKEEAGKAIPVRGRQMDVWCPRAACPQQFLLQLLPMMEWVGKWWDSMTEGQHRSPLDSFTGKREGKASFPPWPLASAPIYTEKQRDPGNYGITVFKCVLILTPIKATMHPKPPYYKHLQGVQRLLSTWSSVVIYQNILIVLQLLFWQIIYSINDFFPLVSKHL